MGVGLDLPGILRKVLHPGGGGGGGIDLTIPLSCFVFLLVYLNGNFMQFGVQKCFQLLWIIFSNQAKLAGKLQNCWRHCRSGTKLRLHV